MVLPSVPDVSRETVYRLEVYRDALLKWQRAVNLISPSTVADVWNRHFLDSMQLASFLPAAARTIFDFGSGAGFPGMVLAILCPNLSVHLVESDQKKCSFLSTVSRETKTPVLIHNCRIEALNTKAIPDVITARALADLGHLLAYAAPWRKVNPELVLLLPKGENFTNELKNVGPDCFAQCEEFPSITDKKARILRISGLNPDVHNA
ncbi:MAG: 16S rRNA (guanine(527)-N(7))-methyltransferase RsmG [Micavibrio aeruginosavorus]|uniref:Ribosomal RNA small subunit methyltransferase G n=1 Tax=Micavibrio aeruginosavorus TaxID=349221 RepID=A0A7T5R2K5_9BACT|nr:MAG: 16S rRNA (guanine(527)-N(7))-methyltransferase RsmG [Micavibrio aeruginosavorus]